MCALERQLSQETIKQCNMRYAVQIVIQHIARLTLCSVNVYVTGIHLGLAAFRICAPNVLP